MVLELSCSLKIDGYFALNQDQDNREIGSTKIEIDKLDGCGYFNMWRKKIRVVLIHIGASKPGLFISFS